jgi:hypothetical protein
MKRMIAGALCAGLLSLSLGAPASADGGASTRNIIFGAAAAGVGTWAIINHNKKVHQKIDEKDAQIHSLDQQRSDAESSYEQQHQAYLYERAVADHYIRETAQLKRRVSQLKQQVAFSAPQPVSAAQQPAPLAATHLAAVSYGWGTL